jgi:uncharacterized protein (TIGR03435 family)
VTCIAAAQPETPAPRKFEVASIKKNNSGPPQVYVNPFVFLPGGRFIATNVTLTEVIVMAYRTRRIQMRGGPSWIDSERFNIVAKADDAEGEVKREQWPQMVQALLEDRFKLTLHREMEERAVYSRVAGKNPPKLQEAKEGEQTAMVPGDRGQMNFQKMPMSGLVNTLANILHTPVVDGTGMTGFFDFTLDPMQFATTGTPGGVQAASPEIFADLILTAVRELGFKLEKQRAPLDITVIDRAEPPTDN